MEISYGTRGDSVLHDIPIVTFTTKKTDQNALSKFVEAISKLIQFYADDLAANPDELHECSIRLDVQSLSKKAEDAEGGDQEETPLLRIKRLILNLSNETRMDLQKKLESGGGLITTLTLMVQDRRNPSG